MERVEEEFLRAYDNYASMILRHIYFRVSDKSLAEDLTQETFFKAWRAIISNDYKKKSSFKSFLYKIANNLVIDYYRQKSKKYISLEEIEEKSMAYEARQKDEINAAFDKKMIERYLSELDENERQILLYRYVDDLKVKEISEITGKTPNNISVIIHRALKKLREKMKNV